MPLLQGVFNRFYIRSGQYVKVVNLKNKLILSRTHAKQKNPKIIVSGTNVVFTFLLNGPWRKQCPPVHHIIEINTFFTPLSVPPHNNAQSFNIKTNFHSKQDFGNKKI